MAAGALLLIALAVPPRAAASDPLWRRIPTMDVPPTFAFTDVARDRVLILGDGVWELPLDGPPGLREVMVNGQPPVRVAAAAHDAAHDRILCLDYFGATGIVTVLTLSPTPHWTTITTSGDVPNPYGEAAAIYDPVRNELVLYETIGNVPMASQVRRLDLDTGVWSFPPVAGVSPPGRFSTVTVYDSRRHRMLLHGGDDYMSPWRHDLWGMSLGDTIAWTPIQLDGADAQQYSGHRGVYDESDDRLIVFGGNAAPHFVARAYNFSTDRWTTFTTPLGPGPDPFSGSYLALDPAHARLLVGAGREGPDGTDLGLWALDLQTPRWTRMFDADPGPLPLAGAASVWDARRHRAVLWGGRSTYEYSHDYDTSYPTGVWALGFGARPLWTPLPGDGVEPGIRQFPTLVIDDAGDDAWMFGGTETYPIHHPVGTDVVVRARYGDVWRLDLGSGRWNRVEPENDGPTAREGHAAVVDPVGRRMLVFGGRDSLHAALGDLWSLSIDPPYRWTPIGTPGPSPVARAFPVLACDAVGRALVMFGGVDASGASLGDVWRLPLDGPPVWAPIGASGSPPRSAGPRPGVWDAGRTRLIVFGDGDAITPAVAQRVWALELATTPQWTELAPLDRPGPDHPAASAVFDPDRYQAVLIWGASGAWLEYAESSIDRLVFSDPPAAPTNVSLIDASATPDRARLAWSVSGGTGFRATVERHEDAAPWASIATVSPDAAGEIHVDDAGVRAGHRYAYRLAWSDDAAWGVSPEQAIAIPTPPPPALSTVFALGAPRPNPAASLLEIPYELPTGEARLELYDVAGRMVLRRTFTPTTGPRAEPVDVSHLAPGVYLVRLTHDRAVLHARAVVLR
ncbi:MAG: T9SS type A sorting domain-containing protein [Candidatus Eisenbacteria bacterium]|uniref:T9SS type A sorting domain-containing protein n=1 Tax=Eiseniibacteriota bacterium TaxID=2212470 RepID=A0A9D6LB12_UNCEI|nr:T9SS type A sorting domain-containing protein [Candidatus Eisenbacteria bacterium]